MKHVGFIIRFIFIEFDFFPIDLITSRKTYNDKTNCPRRYNANRLISIRLTFESNKRHFSECFSRVFIYP